MGTCLSRLLKSKRTESQCDKPDSHVLIRGAVRAVGGGYDRQLRQPLDGHSAAGGSLWTIATSRRSGGAQFCTPIGVSFGRWLTAGIAGSDAGHCRDRLRPWRESFPFSRGRRRSRLSPTEGRSARGGPFYISSRCFRKALAVNHPYKPFYYPDCCKYRKERYTKNK